MEAANGMNYSREPKHYGRGFKKQRCTCALIPGASRVYFPSASGLGTFAGPAIAKPAFATRRRLVRSMSRVISPRVGSLAETESGEKKEREREGKLSYLTAEPYIL